MNKTKAKKIYKPFALGGGGGGGGGGGNSASKAKAVIM